MPMEGRPSANPAVPLSVLCDESSPAVLNQGVNIRFENEQGGVRTGFHLCDLGTAGQVLSNCSSSPNIGKLYTGYVLRDSIDCLH
jgi:hypothetical protein